MLLAQSILHVEITLDHNIMHATQIYWLIKNMFCLLKSEP